jgi:hypothetical protein
LLEKRTEPEVHSSAIQPVPGVQAEVLSEWLEWRKSEGPAAQDAEALRRAQYEESVLALWREVKACIIGKVQVANSRSLLSERIECEDTRVGGLALTRWHQYPVAFLDATMNADEGMIGCLYTSAFRAGDDYRELYKVWLIPPSDESLVVTSMSGQPVTSCSDIADQILGPYLGILTHASES